MAERFAIRFTDMDPESVDTLKRLCGLTQGEAPAPAVSGSKVRLHIEGTPRPPCARQGSGDARASEIRVGSELGFLQVGKQLELEDTQSGAKRPACIDRVEVAVDPTRRTFCQLVVTLPGSSDALAEEHAQAACKDFRTISPRSRRPP